MFLQPLVTYSVLHSQLVIEIYTNFFSKFHILSTYYGVASVLETFYFLFAADYI